MSRDLQEPPYDHYLDGEHKHVRSTDDPEKDGYLDGNELVWEDDPVAEEPDAPLDATGSFGPTPNMKPGEDTAAEEPTT